MDFKEMFHSRAPQFNDQILKVLRINSEDSGEGREEMFFFFFLPIFYWVFTSFIFQMLSRKSPIYPPCSPTHPLPLLGPGVSPVLGHIKFSRPRGLGKRCFNCSEIMTEKIGWTL
jgi:hypothetical protein